MATPLRKTGIGLVGEIPWGTHLCHFFQTKDDLFDLLLPYFQKGLEARELCVWVVGPPLSVEEALGALRRAVPDVDRHLAAGALEVHPHTDWYGAAGAFDLDGALWRWSAKLDEALARGFTGLRVNGSANWMDRADAPVLARYEETVDAAIAGKHMIALCTYALEGSDAADILDVASTHEFALAKRQGRWEMVETRRARNQQSAAAALGQFAIGAPDVPALLEEAARVVAETLAAEDTVVFELVPGGHLVARASVKGTGGAARKDSAVPARFVSAGRDVLQSAEPVVVREPRAMMGVVLRGPSSPWGVLTVFGAAGRHFRPDDVGFLQSVASVLALAIARDRVAASERQEKEALEGIFENIPLMISAYDASGRLLRVNREWEKTLGYTFEEARERDILKECYPDPEVRRQVLEFMRVADRSWRDFRVRTRDGRTIDTSWTRFRLSDGTRLGIGLDITARHRAEQALSDADKQRDALLASETAARAAAEATLERLRAIDSITDTALLPLGLDELLRELLARLSAALSADAAAVLLLDEDTQTLAPRAAIGDTYENYAAIRIPLGAGVTGRIAAEGRPMIVDDYSAVAIDGVGIEGVTSADIRARTGSVMGAPLRFGDRVVGVVTVVSARPRRFVEEDLRLLLLVADRAAPAVELSRLLERLRAGRELQKRLSQRILTAHEEERRRLAVELHDELGQVLTAVKINLASLERMSLSAPPPPLQDAIASVDHAMHRVRDLALDLRPSVLDDLGLAAALRWYADRFARGTDAEVHVSVDAVPPLEPEVETACFRIAQEALTNVSRHAQARHVWLDVQMRPDAIELCLRDDGVGFDVERAWRSAIGGASMGLLGMQERVSLVGGEFSVRRRPEGGTEVRVRFAVSGRAR
jgi:PAS domain S-box-containing protein